MSLFAKPTPKPSIIVPMGVSPEGVSSSLDHRAFGETKVDDHHFVEKHSVVKRHMFVDRCIHACAFQVEICLPEQHEHDHAEDADCIFLTSITAGFVKNDANGNFLFGQSGGSGTGTLDGLSDVTITTPAAGQYLCFNGSEWVNAFIPLNDLSDVVLSSPTSGQVLTFNGSNWVNASPAADDDVETIPLNDLSDVTLTAPSSGQILRFNGSQWVNSAETADDDSETIPLNDLSDVTLSAPSNGQFLRYNSGSGQWENQAGDADDDVETIPLNDLSDVTLTAPSSGQILRFNGSQWVNSAETADDDVETIPLNDLSDVTLSTPADDDFLRFNGSEWVNEAVSFSAVDVLGDLSDVQDGLSAGLTSDEQGSLFVWDGSEWSTSQDVSFSKVQPRPGNAFNSNPHPMLDLRNNGNAGAVENNAWVLIANGVDDSQTTGDLSRVIIGSVTNLVANSDIGLDIYTNANGTMRFRSGNPYGAGSPVPASILELIPSSSASTWLTVSNGTSGDVFIQPNQSFSVDPLVLTIDTDSGNGGGNPGAGTVIEGALTVFRELIATDGVRFGGATGRDTEADGDWRIQNSGSDLVVQRREAGVYVTKGTFSP